LRDPTFSPFGKILACDRQAGRQTDRHTHNNSIDSTSTASNGKNLTNLTKPRQQCLKPSLANPAWKNVIFKRSKQALPGLTKTQLHSPRCYATAATHVFSFVISIFGICIVISGYWHQGAGIKGVTSLPSRVQW